MTKELYPRPRAKIGDLVMFSHKDAKKRVYHQMKVSGAYFTDRWVYVGLASVFDSKKGYVRYGIEANEDELHENITTGEKFHTGESLLDIPEAEGYTKAFEKTFGTKSNNV